MIESVILVIGVAVAALVIANLVQIRQAKGLMELLGKVAIPVPRDYFDPFKKKTIRGIQYGDKTFSGVVAASAEGVYLESVFKFYAVIPWERIAAIRTGSKNGKDVANLRIHYDGTTDRELWVAWDEEFQQHLPETTILVQD